MKRLGFCILALVLAGCIENDIPYPLVECTIEEIAAEGLSGAPAIDLAARRVVLPLEETTDIQAVEITRFIVFCKFVYWSLNVNAGELISILNFELLAMSSGCLFSCSTGGPSCRF